MVLLILMLLVAPAYLLQILWALLIKGYRLPAKTASRIPNCLLTADVALATANTTTCIKRYPTLWTIKQPQSTISQAPRIDSNQTRIWTMNQLTFRAKSRSTSHVTCSSFHSSVIAVVHSSASLPFLDSDRFCILHISQVIQITPCWTAVELF